jgi:hypothetical protein
MPKWTRFTERRKRLIEWLLHLFMFETHRFEDEIHSMATALLYVRDGNRNLLAQGMAYLIDDKYAVTCKHLVTAESQADIELVFHDNITVSAEVYMVHEKCDAALLYLEKSVPCKPLKLSNFLPDINAQGRFYGADHVLNADTSKQFNAYTGDVLSASGKNYTNIELHSRQVGSGSGSRMKGSSGSAFVVGNKVFGHLIGVKCDRQRYEIYADQDHPEISDATAVEGRVYVCPSTFLWDILPEDVHKRQRTIGTTLVIKILGMVLLSFVVLIVLIGGGSAAGGATSGNGPNVPILDAGPQSSTVPPNETISQICKRQTNIDEESCVEYSDDDSEFSKCMRESGIVGTIFNCFKQLIERTCKTKVSYFYNTENARDYQESVCKDFCIDGHTVDNKNFQCIRSSTKKSEFSSCIKNAMNDLNSNE